MRPPPFIIIIHTLVTLCCMRSTLRVHCGRASIKLQALNKMFTLFTLISKVEVQVFSLKRYLNVISNAVPLVGCYGIRGLPSHSTLTKISVDWQSLIPHQHFCIELWLRYKKINGTKIHSVYK